MSTVIELLQPLIRLPFVTPCSKAVRHGIRWQTVSEVTDLRLRTAVAEFTDVLITTVADLHSSATTVRS